MFAPSSLRLLLAGALVVLQFVGAPRAHADAAAQARFHDELARRHYAAGRYDEALREFFLEQRVAPNPRIAFNIALCFQQLGRAPDAFMYFREYLDGIDADDAVEQTRRAQAEAALAQLRPRVALLRVTSEPAGAAVFVDQREHGQYGTTPCVIALDPGEHRVWAAREGHRDAEATTRTELGREVAVSLSLSPVLGALVVEAAVDQASVLVRDVDDHVVAEGASPLRAELPPGDYDIVVSAEGFAAWRGIARVGADEETRERAALEALPPPTGALTVTANHNGALVLLDGDEVGFTPLLLPDVPIGEHQLEVRDGAGVRLPYSGDLRVEARERAWVTVSLERPSVTTRSPLTWAAGGAGALALLGGVGVAGAGQRRYNQFQRAMRAGRPSADYARQGRRLDTVSDTLFITGAVMLTVGVILYFTTRHREDAESSAVVSRSAE